MPRPASIRESDEPDVLESPFDTKPGSRMVWILPSIVIHLIILTAWLSVPGEKPKEAAEKKLVIRSEQAEKLQEFVENANLVELRSEVRRLQEIKQTMATMRADGLMSLESHEDEVRPFAVADAGKALEELRESQEDLIRRQRGIVETLRAINAVFAEADPLLESKRMVELVPFARRLLELRTGLLEMQDDLNKQFLLLRARLDTTDSLMSLATDPAVEPLWECLFQLQEQALGAQSGCSDRLDQIQIKQTNSLKMMVAEAAGFEQREQELTDQAKTAEAEFVRLTREFAEERAKSETREKELLEKVASIEARLQSLRAERNDLVKERMNLVKSPDIEARRQAIQQQVADRDRRNMELSKERNSVNMELNNLRKARMKIESDARRLKPPSPNADKERERLSASMNRYLQALSDRGGDASQQEAAIRIGQEALQANLELIKLIHREESK